MKRSPQTSPILASSKTDNKIEQLTRKWYPWRWDWMSGKERGHLGFPTGLHYYFQWNRIPADWTHFSQTKPARKRVSSLGEYV